MENGMLRRCFYRNSFTSSWVLHRSEKNFKTDVSDCSRSSKWKVQKAQ